MDDFADVGGVVFAGAYLFTVPIVLVDGPQPGPVDAAWLFGLAAAYNRGRRMGGYLDDFIVQFKEAERQQATKQQNQLRNEKWTTNTNKQLMTPSQLERPALHSGLWSVKHHAKKKKRTLKGLYV
jgi:hypothetical protein